MKRKRLSQKYIFLLTGIVLLVLFIVASFHYLTGFSIYTLQLPFKENSTFNGTTFRLLDNYRCGEDCSPCEKSYENLFLVSVSKVNDEAIINFLRDFKTRNHCGTFILFQKGNLINKDWERIISVRKIDSITVPNNYISRAYIESEHYFAEHYFNIMDFSNGKPKRLRVFNQYGSLTLESMILNNNGIHHVTYRWDNNKLISSDTVLQSEIPKKK